ncbi:MAG: hypothetical protein QHH26_07080 [Armatimonadota bacterium]|nr:hypothetical protein [Armatimonadota bacterium]
MRKIFLLTLSILLTVHSAHAEEENKPNEVRIVADFESYDFETEDFTAQGNVKVTYGDIDLIAEKVSGNAGTGALEAIGGVEFRQGDRLLKSGSFSYNFITGEGLASDATAVLDNFYFKGKELKSQEAKYTISDSVFTTCDRPKPHYYLAARELSFIPGQKLTARHVSIYLFGNHIISVPKYTVKLTKKKRQFKLPQIGISRTYGLHAGSKFNLSYGPNTTGTLDIIISTRQMFQGGFEFQRIAGKPFSANLTYRQPYYGGLRSDLLLSRLPEITYRFYSTDMEEQAEDAAQPEIMLIRLLSAETPPKQEQKLSFIGQVGIGQFIEEPNHIKATRFDIRGIAWLRPYTIGNRTYLSPAISFRQSFYNNGDSYTDLGFRLAAARAMGKNAYISAVYANHAIGGSTPFKFDPIEIPHELAAKIGFPLGTFKVEFGGRYNLSDRRLFDSEISIAKTIHCIEPKITWQSRFKEISLDVSLLGF